MKSWFLGDPSAAPGPNNTPPAESWKGTTLPPAASAHCPGPGVLAPAVRPVSEGWGCRPLGRAGSEQRAGSWGQQPFAQPAMLRSESGGSESDREGPHVASPTAAEGRREGGLRSEGPRRLPAWTRAQPSCPQLGGGAVRRTQRTARLGTRDLTSLRTPGPLRVVRAPGQARTDPHHGCPPAPAGQRL